MGTSIFRGQLLSLTGFNQGIIFPAVQIDKTESTVTPINSFATTISLSTPSPGPTETFTITQTITILQTPSPAYTSTPTPGLALAPTSISPLPSSCTQEGIVWQSSKDGMIEICVPEGRFYNDSNAEVYLNAFWFDKYEVSNQQYALCVKDGACMPPRLVSSKTRDFYYGNSIYNNYPVIYVSWDDAKSYCTWAKRRLPDEEEWKKAARGPKDGRIYPWGNELPNSSLLNFGNKYSGDTSPVDGYPSGASYYGILNMGGNVMEWTSDHYIGNSNYFIIKGGAWSQASSFVMISSSYADTRKGDADLGIRCMIDAP